MKGFKDDQLFLRFIQFGVFSPINRLHCSKLETNTKEPWTYMSGTGAIAERFLRLRHLLLIEDPDNPKLYHD
jgi:alpha-glucosidase (family GH31 glycosyl hydrolase)